MSAKAITNTYGINTFLFPFLPGYFFFYVIWQSMLPLPTELENINIECSTTPYILLHKSSVKLLLPSCVEDNSGSGPFWIAATALRVGSDGLMAFKERNPLAVGWRAAS